MRLTWLVLGVVLAAGAVAFINTDEAPEALPKAAPDAVPGRTGLQRNAAAKPVAAPSESELKQEKTARALLEALGRARAEGDAAKTAAFEARLRKEAWDAPSARRHAYRMGRDLLEAAGRQQGAQRIQALDGARRLLSRVLYLPEMFDAKGASTSERTKLMDQLQKLNRQVMRYGSDGLPGVTRPYDVEAGIRPVQIVSRQGLPMGSNAILLWNQGNLNPLKLRAGGRLLLPLEPLSLHVDTQRFRMAIFIGDWFVKEFRVGVGREDTPTPLGEFRVHSREKNPDWWKPGGKRIPFGHPDNELGSAWIALESDEWPVTAGYGIHGTNKPATVGTRCSNGCVRLENSQATELYDWVRTASNGGQATRVFIR